MKTKSNDILMQNKVFMWIAFMTGLILMIPFLAMQLQVSLPDPGGSPGEVNWALGDFIVMGALIFGTGSMFVLAARNIRSTENRIIVGIAFLLVFLWLWAELAVGIFTNWGS